MGTAVTGKRRRSPGMTGRCATPRIGSTRRTRQAGSNDTTSARSISTGRSTLAPTPRIAVRRPLLNRRRHSCTLPLLIPSSTPTQWSSRRLTVAKDTILSWSSCLALLSWRVETAKRDLGLSLVAVVAGTRPLVSPAMVRDYLATFFGIVDAAVRRHDPEDFIVRFTRHEDRNAVLHTRLHDTPFLLIWHPWRRTSLASAGSFHYRVLVGMRRVLLHVRSRAVAHTVLGQVCAQIELAPLETTPADDDTEFFVAAWCLHPRFIPEEKIIFIPEPDARVPGNALTVHADVIMLNRLPGLRYLEHPAAVLS